MNVDPTPITSTFEHLDKVITTYYLKHRRMTEEGPNEYQWADQTDTHFGPIFGSVEEAETGRSKAFREHAREQMEAAQ